MRRTNTWRNDPNYQRMDPSKWEQKRRVTEAGVVRYQQRWVHDFDGHHVVRRYGSLNWRPITDDELAGLLLVDSLRYLLAG